MTRPGKRSTAKAGFEPRTAAVAANPLPADQGLGKDTRKKKHTCEDNSRSAEQCMKSGDLHLAVTHMPAHLSREPEKAAALHIFVQV